MAFTYRYSQPDEYHYCLDSVIMPRLVAELLPEPREGFRALDVCAGCGIIGLELGFHAPWIKLFDFMELQATLFEPHFRSNKNGMGFGHGYRFVASDFAALSSVEYQGRYDLIVCNPPYFRRGEGVQPTSRERTLCRFFDDEGPAKLVRGISDALAPGGRAYLLMRDGARHGRRDDEELERSLGEGRTWAQVDLVRGTRLIEIQRVP